MRKQFSSARASWRCCLVCPPFCPATSAASPPPASPALARASKRQLCRLGLLRRLRSRLSVLKMMFCEPWKSSARKLSSSARGSWRCHLVFPQCCLATSAASRRRASPALARASKRQLCRLGSLRQLGLLHQLELRHPRFRLGALRTTFYGPWRDLAHRQLASAQASWLCQPVYQPSCLATSTTLLRRASPALVRASRRLRCRLGWLRRLRCQPSASKMMFCELWRCSADRQSSSAQAFWDCLRVLRLCCLATSVASLRPASPVHARVSRRLLCRLGLLRPLELLHRFRPSASRTTFCGPWKCSADRQLASARASWRCHLVYRLFCLATSAALRRRASLALVHVSRRLPCRPELPRQLPVRCRRSASRTTFCGHWKCSTNRQFSSAPASWRCLQVLRQYCLATLAASHRQASPALALVSRRLLCRLGLRRQLPLRSRRSASRTTSSERSKHSPWKHLHSALAC